MTVLGLTSAVDLQAAELVVSRSQIQLSQLRESITDTRRGTQTNMEVACL